MKEIETSKLNRNLKTILEEVKNGEVFALTRYGKVVATISAAKEGGMVVKLENPVETSKSSQYRRDELLRKINRK